jgi:hypothetical protein
MIFSEFKGHNSGKNQWVKNWTRTRSVFLVWQSNVIVPIKYQMNIWKHKRKKCRKLIICENQIWTCMIWILVSQGNVPNIKWIYIWKHERKKCRKLIIRYIFLSPRAITLWKINGSKPNLKLILVKVRKTDLRW